MAPAASSLGSSGRGAEMRRSLAVRSLCLQLADALGGQGLLSGALLALPLHEVVDTLHRLADGREDTLQASRTPDCLPQTAPEASGQPQLQYHCLGVPPVQYGWLGPPPPHLYALGVPQMQRMALGHPAAPQRALGPTFQPPDVSRPPPPSSRRVGNRSGSQSSRTASQSRQRPTQPMALRVDTSRRSRSSARAPVASSGPPVVKGSSSGPPVVKVAQPWALLVCGGSRGDQRIELLIVRDSEPLASQCQAVPKVKLLGKFQTITKESFGAVMTSGPGSYVDIVTPGFNGFFRLRLGRGPQPKVNLELQSLHRLQGNPKRSVGKLVSQRGQAVEAKNGMAVLDEADDAVHLYHVPLKPTAQPQSLPPLTPPRQGSAAAVVGDVLYVTGGDAAGSVARLDDPSKGWRPAPALPVAASDHSAVAFQGRLVVAGGRGPSGELLRGVWSLEPSSGGGWESMGELVWGRAGLSLAEVAGLLVAVGGEGEAEETPHSAEVWEEGEGRWSVVDFLFTHPVHRAIVAAVPLKGK